MFNVHERHLEPVEAPLFSGRVTFAAYVNDCTVEVDAVIEDDVIDWDKTEINWNDVDLSPILHDSQLDSIQSQFDENRHNIIEFDQV